MQTRRNVLRNGLLMAGAVGGQSLLPGVVERALAITPDPGTTFLDAEHVVILMQENRSFDHMFGTLRGVRGFNDRRTMRQSDGASVFFQRDEQGEATLPWHADLKTSKITWMGDTPHARSDHLDAWNGGAYSNWIAAKRTRRFPDVPVTMAYHTRDDLPFYYALADAFTVCDQNFAGSITETAPNRLFMWTGTVREQHETGALAYLKNGQTQPGNLAWTSFPERLERAGVSWKFYQNDSWCESPLSTADALWLGNDGDNTMERLAAVKPKFSPSYRQHTSNLLDGWNTSVSKRKAELVDHLATLAVGSAEWQDVKKWIDAYSAQEARLEQKREHGNASFASLAPFDQAMHSKVVTTNAGDPDFRKLDEASFIVNGQNETRQFPKGDVLHQLREDVRAGTLPMVSWLVAAANFSAHPGRPLYGAWYISEVMKILTEKPEMWKKTIFILTFDENDGLFDHVPPFVACDPLRPESGKTSQGLNPAPEYAYKEDERIQGTAEKDVRDGPIGLGFRVPMLVASPWSRGGWVNSQVCDHSSIIRFLEVFIGKKLGKDVTQTEISEWRRAISGDLTSCFQPAGPAPKDLPFLDRDEHLLQIEEARFKPLPNGFTALAAPLISERETHDALLAQHLWQEPGTKPSCPVPYELTANGEMSADGSIFQLALAAGNNIFGEQAAGAPFTVYLRGVREGSAAHNVGQLPNNLSVASYAVKAGDVLRDRIDLSRFSSDDFEIEVFGPNGFYRQFIGNRKQLAPTVQAVPAVREKGQRDAPLLLHLANPTGRPVKLKLKSRDYIPFEREVVLKRRGTDIIAVPVKSGEFWYDVELSSPDISGFKQRFAGRAETGIPTTSDPAMARTTMRHPEDAEA